jgi:hypothetical protein
MTTDEANISATPPHPPAAGVVDSSGQATSPPSQYQPGLFIRLFRGLLLTAAILVVAFVALGLFLTSSRGREWRRRSAEADSFRVLAQAKSPAELEEAVGDLGIVFRTKDEGWIAVRYLDRHAGGIWSSAVARDSGGRWFVSSYHFCGKFEGYRRGLIHGSVIDSDAKLHIIDRIARSETLDAGRELLVELGFQETEPPVLEGER